jgi:hypothetical protein
LSKSVVGTALRSRSPSSPIARSDCDQGARVLCVFWAIGANMIRAWADGTLDFTAACGRARQREKPVETGSRPSQAAVMIGAWAGAVPERAR